MTFLGIDIPAPQWLYGFAGSLWFHLLTTVCVNCQSPCLYDTCESTQTLDIGFSHWTLLSFIVYQVALSLRVLGVELRFLHILDILYAQLSPLHFKKSSYVPDCMSVYHMCTTEVRREHPLELDNMVVSYHVCAGN